MPCPQRKSADILEEHTTSTLKDEEKAEQELLSACLMQVFCFAYSSTLKMEVICSSKTSIDFH
jgi:hypothetical protein